MGRHQGEVARHHILVDIQHVQLEILVCLLIDREQARLAFERGNYYFKSYFLDSDPFISVTIRQFALVIYPHCISIVAITKN